MIVNSLVAGSNGGTAKQSTFWIKGEAFPFDVGMTWYEYSRSAYNTSGSFFSMSPNSPKNFYNNEQICYPGITYGDPSMAQGARSGNYITNIEYMLESQFGEEGKE